LDESITVVLDNQDILPGVCGANDGNLRVLEQSLGGRISTWGNELRAEGLDERGAARFRAMLGRLVSSVEQGESPSPELVRALAEEEDSGDPIREGLIQIPHGLG
jgi:phosphate starvation-inducible PhoH-like protein